MRKKKQNIGGSIGKTKWYVLFIKDNEENQKLQINTKKGYKA